MKLRDFSRRQRATQFTFSERTLASVVKEREKQAELLASSRQLIAASRKLLSQQAEDAPRKLAGHVGGVSADMAGTGSAERETGQRKWDGKPDAPECSAWHWIEDGDGLRPVLWHGEDWPTPSRGVWQDGVALLSPNDLSRAHYHGPLTVPAASTLSSQDPTDQGG